MKRRKVIRIAIALAVLAVLYTAGWHILASQIEGLLREAAEPAPDKDWHASWERLEASGFPFAFRMNAIEPEIVWGRGEHSVTWTGPGILMNIRPWNSERLLLGLPQRQNLVVLAGSRQHSFMLMMESGRVDVGIPSGRLEELDAVLSEVSVSSPEGGVVFLAESLAVSSRRAGNGEGQDVSFNATALGIEGVAPAGMAERVERASLVLRQVAEMPPDGTARERIDAWRRAGGYVEIAELAVEWPPVTANATGNLALDREVRPIGAFRLELTGYRELLMALEAAGELKRGQSTLVAATLDFMAGPAVDGARRIDIDVSMQHGILSIGPLAIMRIDPLWPPLETTP